MKKEIIYKFISDEKPKRPRGRPRKQEQDKTSGRPQRYTEELALEVCLWLSNGKSLTSYCKKPGNPAYSTIMIWVHKDKEGFAKRYAEARKYQAECIADELMDIADDGENDYLERIGKNNKKSFMLDPENINRSRLRVETRKWIASKLLASKFGDKLTLGNEDGGPAVFKVVYERQTKNPIDDGEKLNEMEPENKAEQQPEIPPQV